MKKFSDKEYKIYENLAQAKSILRKFNGSIEDDEFLQIADATNKDGWTGLLTRLVYKDSIDLDEVLGFYPDLKKSKLDLGKLNKMSYDDIVDSLYKDVSQDDGITFAARFENYLIFHVSKYESGLKICSPSWCLKTKNYWDRYTKTGIQFVAIEDQYVNKGGKTKLISPSSPGYFGSYSNNKNPKVRYGITYYPNKGKFEAFDDNNKYLNREDIPTGIRSEIINYTNTNNNIVKRFEKTAEYDKVKEWILDEADEYSNYSWSSAAVGNNSPDFEEEVGDFMNSALNIGIDIVQFHAKYKEKMESDLDLTQSGSFIDFLLYVLSGRKNHADGGVPLGGFYLEEAIVTDNSYKYIYGFAQNKYGRMFILQSYDTIYDWYLFLLENFMEIFMNTDDYSYSYDFDQRIESASFKENANYINKHISLEEIDTEEERGSFYMRCDNFSRVVDMFFEKIDIGDKDLTLNYSVPI